MPGILTTLDFRNNIVGGQSVGGAVEGASGVFPIDAVGVAVDKAARTAAGGGQFVIAVQREARRGCVPCARIRTSRG